jgi:hypothetical protein
MPTTVKIRRSGTSSATPSALEHGEIAINYADGKVFWKNASNVITSFTFQSYALASHTHSISDVTGLQTALDGKASSSHTHSISDVTGLQTALDGKASSSHTHAASDITSGTLDIARIANDAVTYAKLQNVSATDRLLGRSSAGAGDVEEITCTSFGRSLISSADAATARTTLSVQPTASPAFTGAATFANTGDVVPLTVTNAGTANSFVVNDASGDTTPFVIDASGRVGVGITPTAQLHVAASGSAELAVRSTDVSAWKSRISFGNASAKFEIGTDINGAGDNNFYFFDIAASTTRLTISSTGTATFAGQVLVTAGSVSACSVAAAGDPNTGLYFPAANVAAVVTDGVERVRVSSAGNVTIGEANSANARLMVAGGSSNISSARATYEGTLQINESSLTTLASIGGIEFKASVFGSGYGVKILGADDGSLIVGNRANSATWSESMRITQNREMLIGQSTTTDPAGANTNGIALAPDYISVSRSSFECLRLNIKAADGTIVALFQDAALEGSISVAGNTVSYNAFCGSHWAQLSDQSRPAILRGTVMETIDEMCDWPEDGGSSDRLVRVKVSDTQSSRRVYGVFLGWDGQYASTGDMYVAGLGAYMVRVSGVVQSGDLIESAGDGTARTQADDIVRSTTIGKVSSTHRIAEYDDGSYLVPCVLMCG